MEGNKPKCCDKCLTICRNYGTLPKDSTNFSEIFKDTDRKSQEYKEASKSLESCPEKCCLYLYASNCMIDKEGYVNLNSSQRRY